MPISRALAAAGIVLLAACAQEPVTREAPTSITLTDGLVVSGAPGWCVDAASTQTADDATVVIFGSCAALNSDARQPRPSVPGIVSVSIEAMSVGAPPVEVVDEFLLSDAGQAALSRDGSADTVDILETEISDETLVLHAVDRSGLATNASAEYWRALFDINGRGVTVSLVGIESNVGAQEDWRAALDAQVARLKAVNEV